MTLDKGRIIQLDSIIGKIRIVIALFVIAVELLAGHKNAQAITLYLFLFLYSTLWLIFQTKRPTPIIGKLGYFHLFMDLLFISTATVYQWKGAMSYYDGLYILLLLMYLIRFGKKPAFIVAGVASVVALYICIFTHFKHSASHFILIGTIYALIYFVGNILEVEKNLREKLTALSTCDELTGMHNFRYFQEQLGFQMEYSERYRVPFSIAILDLDDFKQYNDSFGHDAGNELLKTLAGLLKDSIRKSDCVARFGGEEFVIMLPHTDKPGAVNLLEKIREVIYSYSFPHRRVSISIGIACYPGDSLDQDKLFKYADDRLYQAKNEGKNCVRY